MADALPFAAPVIALVASLSAPAVSAQQVERFGQFSVAQEQQRLPMSDMTRPSVRLAWTSEDRRVELSWLDTGVVVLMQQRVRDAAGRVRCSANGPLIVYDTTGWMTARWREMGWEQGNFLRTCHVIDRRMVKEYEKEFAHDAAQASTPIAALKSAAEAAFGADRGRCVDIKDGRDPAIAPRAACETMVTRP